MDVRVDVRVDRPGLVPFLVQTSSGRKCPIRGNVVIPGPDRR